MSILKHLLFFSHDNQLRTAQQVDCYVAGMEPLVESLKIYDTTSDDFVNKKFWAFDDGPYVANIDFLINLYDNIFLSKNDIWTAEVYLMQKVKSNKIQRLTANISIFARFGIVGPNAHSAENDRSNLNNLFK